MSRLGRDLWSLSWLASLALAQKLTSTPANFRGFQLYANGAVETITCSDSATFYTSSTYGACCYPGTRCNFATECEGGTAYQIFGGSYTCSSAYPNCYTMTIYDKSPSASSSWLMRGCATNWSAFTIYREVVTTSSQSSTIAPTTGPTVSKQTPSATPTSANPTSRPSETSEPAAAGASQAWIAGAVIGPVVAVAGLGFLAFWLGMKRGKKNTVEPLVLADSSTSGRMSYHPSFQYGGGSPMGAETAPFMQQTNQDPALTGTPSPPTVSGYMYPPQGAYSPGQHPAAPQQHPGPYPAPYSSPGIPQGHFPGPGNMPELANEPIHR
ncbi:hypothetical protein QBC47DRAFT_391839 [Echria macrotheca]|uniref:Uncharacterized protein n=1 Tax=Echria macrotheca TaxID=438768 RepID=A0AAJ0B4B5_9PEZI|nr:hypothetical protein QBC47DRAFT_391839 [Echria macrotheca]